MGQPDTTLTARRAAVLIVLVGGAELLVLPQLGAPPTPTWAWLYLGLLAAAWWLAARRSPDGRSLAAWTGAQVRWLLRPRTLYLPEDPRGWRARLADRRIVWLLRRLAR